MSRQKGPLNTSRSLDHEVVMITHKAVGLHLNAKARMRFLESKGSRNQRENQRGQTPLISLKRTR